LLAAFVASVQAAVPTVADPDATDIQGVSALLKGEVDPQGLATTYRFEYVDQATFTGSGFTNATKTPSVTAGSGSGPRPARASISGLTPATTYHYRLVATNSSGNGSVEATFATTEGFGFKDGAEGFSAEAIAEGGGAATSAGSHPYRLSFGIAFNQGGEFEDQPGVSFPDGDLRDLEVELPKGLILNPSVIGQCSGTDFGTPRSSPFEESKAGESCPADSQVGTVSVTSARGNGVPRRFGLFNLAPAPGITAQLGFAPFGSPVVLDLKLQKSAGGEYTLVLAGADVSQALDLSSFSLNLWGTPWDVSHDGERGNCLNETEPTFPWAKCSVGAPKEHPPLAFLTLPGRCSGPLGFEARASSWQQPKEVGATAESEDSGGAAQLACTPGLEFQPTAVGLLNDEKASSPAGYNFRLSVSDPGLTEPFLKASPPPRDIVVHLPEGVTVNPSVGAGLITCSPSQFDAETAFSPPGAGCPNGSKIGSFSARTPIAGELLEGAIFLATPDDPTSGAHGAQNPFDSLIAAYLVAKGPQRGLLVKLAGRIDPDPSDGTLTATFQNLPQLPYTDLDLTFRAGQRSFLITPPACGPAVSRIEMIPWASEVATKVTDSSTEIRTGIGAGPCPAPGAPPFAPQAVAGALNSNVGSYTPYFVHLTRRDTEQEITSYSLVLPKGITGKLAGIPFCPEGDIERARQNRGEAETANPSCPTSSQVGRTLTGYGVGGALTYAPGRIFLAGPYHGAPLSLVTVNSATVGPFDLGTIVIRSAFDIDPRTAQLQIDSAASDPIPHIIDGIPLHLRDVRIYVDRYQFTHNPSSCEPSSLFSTLTGSGATFSDPADDSSATAGSHFQLLNCLTLGFRPKLGIRLRGPHRRGAYPSLRATFASRGAQDSNLKRIEVTLPHSEFLAQNHIRTVCTRPQFDAERCPQGSVYGHAVAYTPLFDEPLRGDVYLRSSTHKLPDLVASLRSGSIRIVLEGKIGPAKQGIRTLFKDLPDAPIERFTMTLNGGRRGLLVNSSDICRAPPLATVRALGQNDIGASFSTRLRGQCVGKKAKGKGGKK
jgi:hypothetical protein